MVTNRIGFVVCASGVLAFAAARASEIPRDYRDLKYPPIHDIKVPEATRFTLPNGIVVYLIADHELPKVNIHVTVPVGSRWEPADKTGLASITATVMRSGGSISRNGDKLDEELDRIGASIETGIGADSGGAFAALLKEDLDRGLDIVADIIQHPAFPQDKIDLAKIQIRDGIARRNDDPNGIVFREFSRILYGQDSPYVRMPEYATIDAITRDDLVAFHKRYFQPEGTIVGVNGDIDPVAVRARIEKAFGSWPRGGQPKPVVPAVDAAAHPGFYSITKTDMAQSWVMMGMLGGRRDDPDFYALEVMNTVLGGGMSSRLFSNVRTTQGLAYAVYSGWSAEWDHPGTFYAGGSSKPETTVKLYGSMLDEVKRLAAGGATDEELVKAKDQILKGFAFEFDNSMKVIARLMSYEYYGYPRDYLQQYHAHIIKVSNSDVARVAKQYLKTDQFAVLFVGNGKYEAPLTTLGAIRDIDITIPAPKQKELAAATPESIARGRKLLGAARSAMGGAALSGVKDYTLILEAKVDTPGGPMNLKMENSASAGGKFLQKIQTPMGEMKIGFDGDSAWMSGGGHTQDLPGSQKAEYQNSSMRETIWLLQRQEETLTVQSLGVADFEGTKAEAVVLSDPARKLEVTLYLDPSTNMIIGKRYVSAAMGPPTETDEVYSDYRDVNGIKAPYKTAVWQGGKMKGEMTVSEVRINPGIPDTAYKKP